PWTGGTGGYTWSCPSRQAKRMRRTSRRRSSDDSCRGGRGSMGGSGRAGDDPRFGPGHHGGGGGGGRGGGDRGHTGDPARRSEEHTSELQSRFELVCRLLLEKKQP